MNVITAIYGRRSIRAFLDLPVEQKIIEEILEAARWAPSGGNSQPWNICVITGETKKKISKALVEARNQNVTENPDYQYYPVNWVEPYKSRQLTCGLSMYKALGVLRKSPKNRMEAWNRNYSFFGAPTVLIFLVHKSLSQGSWLDYGMFIQNVALAAQNYGLGTCVQASPADYPDVIRKNLNVNEDYIVVCSIGLGFPDLNDAVNQFRTEREDIEVFTNWYR